MIAPRSRLGMARSAAWMALAGMLVVGAAACGGPAQPSTQSSSSSGSTSSLHSKAVAFAACMRSHGIQNFPDPTAGKPLHSGSKGRFMAFNSKSGTMSFDLSGVDTSTAQYQSAQKACGPTLGVKTGGPAPSSQAFQTAAVDLSKCMRSHGVAKFPDPTFGSGSGSSQNSIAMDINGAKVSFAVGAAGIDPNSSQFQSAMSTCQSAFRKAMQASAKGTGQ